jgi:RNA polymerase sigma-70 factor, ECF subfamily
VTAWRGGHGGENDRGVHGNDQGALLPPQVSSALALSLKPTQSEVLCESASELSDEELIRAVRRGEPKIGRLLYARLARVIDSTLARVVGPGQPDHDDLVQAAFEEVLLTLFKGTFKGRCKLSSWAASIACHIGLNAIRSRKTERRIFDRRVDLDGDISGDGNDPEAAIEARDELALLRTALATLSPGRAEAIILHDALGYDVSEVAALTQSTEAAVQSRLSRGRRDLAERIPLVRRRGQP